MCQRLDSALLVPITYGHTALQVIFPPCPSLEAVSSVRSGILSKPRLILSDQPSTYEEVER